MPHTALNLAGLLASRICHDLISPVAAIDNGLELLEMTGAQSGPELDLIGESSAAARHRLSFFRICFGAADPAAQISTEVFSDTMRAAMTTQRLTIETQITDTEMPRRLAKLTALIALCVESSLPVGGKITVSQRPSEWHVSADSRRVDVPTDLWRHVTHSDPLPAPLQASKVQFPLACYQARAVGRDVHMRSTEKSILVIL